MRKQHQLAGCESTVRIFEMDKSLTCTPVTGGGFALHS